MLVRVEPGRSLVLFVLREPTKEAYTYQLSPHRQATMRSHGAQCERSSVQGGSRDAHFAVTVYSRAILAS